ncbi:PAS domain S-box protein [Baaleninema sp.]|uniref:PAS domain S-box protein n=1 Tax=Baaleninema sp. TaxID=3101197 RepID=UPI003D03AAAE
MSATLSTLRDGVVTIDRTGTVTAFNAVAEQLTGQAAEAAIGRPLKEVLRLVSPQRFQAVELSVSALESWESPRHFQNLLLRAKNGSSVSVDCTVTAVGEVGESAKGWSIALHDLSERHFAQLALEANETRFRCIFDRAFNFIWLLMPDGTLAEANQRVLDFADLSLSEILGDLFWEGKWWRLEESAKAQVRQAVRQAAAGDAVQFDLEFTHPQTEAAVVLDLSVKPVVWEIDRTLLLVVEGQDISERKRSQQQLQAVNRELEAQVRERTQQLQETIDRLETEMARRQRIDAALTSLVSGTAAVTGRDFFPALVQHIATALDVPNVLVSKLQGDRLQALAVWSDGELQSNFSSRIEGSPSQITLETGFCCYPSGVRQAFPKDPDLACFEAESYLGVCLRDTEGNPIGHLCVIDRQPCQDPAYNRSILQVFAARAAAELERVRATEALQQSEQRFRNLVEASSDWVWESDLQGKFTYASPQVEEILGLNPEELLDRYPWDFMTSNDAQRNYEIFLEVASQQEAFRNHEALFLHAQTREEVVIEASGVPVFDGEGDLQGYRGIARDVSDRRQADERLRSSYATNRALIDALPDLLFRIRGDGVFVNYHSPPDGLLWMSPNDFLGKHIAQVLPPEVASMTIAAVENALATRSLQSFEYHMPIDGQVRYWEARVTASAANETIVIVRDITDAKQAELELRQSQAFLNLVIDNIPQAIFWQDRDAVYRGCNRTFARDKGFDRPEDLIGQRDRDLPDYSIDIELCGVCHQRVMETDTPECHVIEEIRRPEGGMAWLDVNRIPLHDDDGNVIGLLVTYEDITQRRRTEALLRQQAKAMNAAQDGIAILNAEERYVYLNPAHLKVYGYDLPDELIGRSWRVLYREEERERLRRDALPQLRERGEWRGEVLGLRRDGSTYPQDISLTALDDGGIVCIVRDASDRKRAEDALRESQQRLQAILDNTTSVLYLKDLQGRYLLVNSRFSELFDLTPQEIIGKTDAELISSDIAEQFRDNDLRVIQRESPEEFEERVPLDGKTLTYLSIKFPLKDDAGRSYAIGGISTDISDRKQAEQQLRESQRFIQRVADAIPDILYIYDLVQGRNVYVNQEIQVLLGYSPEEIAAMGEGILAELIHPDDWEHIVQGFSRFDDIDDATVLETEYRLRHANGEWRWMLSREAVFARTEEGKPTQLIGVSSNITDRKRTEERLRLNQRAIEASSNGIVIVDAQQPDYPLIYVNPAFEQITGYTAEEVLGRNCRFLQGVDRQQPEIDELREALKYQGSCTVVLRNYRKDGRMFWNEISISPIYDTENTVTHYLGIQNDITEAKQAELERHLAQERLEYLLVSSPGVIYSCKTGDDFAATYMSENVESLTGYKAEQFVSAPNFWGSCLHPDDVARVFEDVQQVFETDCYNHEYRFRFADGCYHWVYDQLKLIRDEAGNPVEILGYWTDISDRKQAETELQQAKDRLQAVLDAVPGLVSWMSYDVNESRAYYLGVNQHLADSYGLPTEAFVGRMVGFQDRQSEFAQWIDRFFQSSDSQMACEIETTVRGQLHTYLMVSQKYDRGRSAVSVGIDISGLKQAEFELKTSLHDKELLLKEVHHRVKNNLQVISSIFSLQSQFTEEDRILSILEESQNRIRTMALIHEKLYQSDSFSNVDFADYVQNLAHTLFSSYHVSFNLVQLETNVEPISLNLDTAIPCGLLVNELISNSLKHGFPEGRSGKTSLEFRKLSQDERLVLKVSDTGVGFPENLDIARTTSLGLRLVRSLTRQLRGKLEMYNRNGAVFQVTFSPLRDRTRG